MWKVLVISLVFVYSTTALIQCPPDFCDKVECDQGLNDVLCSSKGAKLRQRSSLCGCCNTCIQQIEEGGKCPFSFLLGLPFSAECADGLTCDRKTYTCQKEPAPSPVQTFEPKEIQSAGPCARKRSDMQKLYDDTLQNKGQRLLGWSPPDCDSNGEYKGKQCSGSQCYCVDKNGENIGYSHYRWESKDGITCECARQKSAIRKSGLIGRMVSCDEFGDFKNIQCTGSVCYCVNQKNGKQIGKTGVNIGKLDSLNC